MKLIRSLSIYTSVGVISSGISFLMMPILTHYLSKQDYGTLSLFNTYVTILIPILSLSSTSILSVEYFRFKVDKFKDLFVSSLFVPFLGFVSFSLLFIVFQNYLIVLTELDSNWILIIPLFAFLSVVNETLQTQLIIRKKADRFGLINLSKFFIELALTLFFVIILLTNWKGRIWSVGLTLIILLLVGLSNFKAWGLLQGKLRKDKVLKSVLFGAPLMFHVLGKFAINQSDRIFLAKMISIEETGLYSVGYIIGSIVLIIANAGHKVFNPFFFERMNDITQRKKIEIVRFSYLFLLVLILLVLFLLIATPFIFKYLIDIKFLEASNYVLWISLAYLFWGGYLLFSDYIFFLKKTKILAYLAIVNVMLNFALNFYLINQFGAIGAAYATTLSFLVVFILIAIISNRLFPMPWFRFKEILKTGQS